MPSKQPESPKPITLISYLRLAAIQGRSIGDSLPPPTSEERMERNQRLLAILEAVLDMVSEHDLRINNDDHPHQENPPTGRS